jgi:hypothetical protein
MAFADFARSLKVGWVVGLEIKGYFDESEEADTSFCMAGWFAPTDRWRPFEDQWATILQKEKAHISTSYVERQNLTMRMGMRRFTRLTNAFSKKVENLAHSVSIHFAYYNFCRFHESRTIRNADGTKTKRTPAMAAGIADHQWSLTQLVGLLD